MHIHNFFPCFLFLAPSAPTEYTFYSVIIILSQNIISIYFFVPLLFLIIAFIQCKKFTVYSVQLKEFSKFVNIWLSNEQEECLHVVESVCVCVCMRTLSLWQPSGLILHCRARVTATQVSHNIWQHKAAQQEIPHKTKQQLHSKFYCT